MMCPKCGRTIPDGTQCPCGAPVLSSNPAVNLIKTLGSSPKFLAAAILTSVMVLFSILASMGSKDLLVSPVLLRRKLRGGSGCFLSCHERFGKFPGRGDCGGSDPQHFDRRRDVDVLRFVPQHPKRQCFHRRVDPLQSVGYYQLGLVLRGSGCNPGGDGGCPGGSGGNGRECLLFRLRQLCSGLCLGASLFGLYRRDLAGVLALYIVYYICIVKTINRVKASALHGVPDNRVPRFLTGF